MAQDYERIPFQGYHRGIGLHVDQNAQRLDIVRAELDRIIDMSDPDELLAFLECVSNSPEARHLSRVKLLAMLEISAERREIRPPGLSVEILNAYSFLDSLQWRDDTYFGSMLEYGRLRAEGGVLREERLKDDRQCRRIAPPYKPLSDA
jgi:hypothetical protein